MSSQSRDQAGGNPASNASGARRVALPAIEVHAAEASTLNIPVQSAGTTASTQFPSQAFPSTPTTLGGQAVRQSQGEGTALITFAPTTATNSSIGPASPHGAFPPASSVTSTGRERYASSAASSLETGIHNAFRELHEELVSIGNGHLPPLSQAERVHLEDVISNTVGLDLMLRCFQRMPSAPSVVSSAVSAWNFYVIELSSTYPPLSDTIVTYLNTRSSTLLYKAWADLIEPQLRDPSSPSSTLPQQDATPSLTSPLLQRAALTRTGIPQATAVSRFDRHCAPSIITTSDQSLETHDHNSPAFYNHRNRNIASHDGSYTSPSVQLHPSSTVNEESPGELLRVSLESIESEVAVIEGRLGQLTGNGLDRESEKAGQLDNALRKLRKLGDRMTAMLGSRSHSASPTATAPVLNLPRNKRLLGVTGLTIRSEEHLPLAQTTFGPQSPPPWFVPPRARAPAGARAIINPSGSSGRYRPEGIVSVQAPLGAATVQPTQEDEASRRVLPSAGSDPSTFLPPTATSQIGIDVMQLLDSAGPGASITDPNTWFVLYNHTLRPCVFAAAQGNTDPSAPSSSTATIRVDICCIEQRHRELSLPCTLPMHIPVHIDLSTLLRQLEISQGTRISQMMMIVAQSFIARRGSTNDATATQEAATPSSPEHEDGDENADSGASGSGAGTAEGKKRAF